MYFRTYLNPLKLFPWEPEFQAPNLPENPDPEDVLNFLCPLDVPSDMSALRQRYIEVSEKDRDVFLTLEEAELKENLFGPLRQAKTNYVIGNYVGSIALCGIVAEKVAILIHKISVLDANKRKDFEEALQSKRVKYLKNEQLIEKQSVKDFGDIRASRKSVLHYWNAPEERISKQAVQAYACATRLVIAIMDVQIVNGNVELNAKLRKYLEDRGEIVVKKDDE